MELHPHSLTNSHQSIGFGIQTRLTRTRTMDEAFPGKVIGDHGCCNPCADLAFGVYRPAAVPRSSVTQIVVLPDGERRRIADPPTGSIPAAEVAAAAGVAGVAPPTGRTCRAPLGTALGARSGDKGGNANIGLWARDDAGYAWACRVLERRAAARAARPRGGAAAHRTVRVAQPASAQRRGARAAWGWRRVLDPARRPGEGTRRRLSVSRAWYRGRL